MVDYLWRRNTNIEILKTSIRICIEIFQDTKKDHRGKIGANIGNVAQKEVAADNCRKPDKNDRRQLGIWYTFVVC